MHFQYNLNVSKDTKREIWPASEKVSDFSCHFSHKHKKKGLAEDFPLQKKTKAQEENHGGAPFCAKRRSWSFPNMRNRTQKQALHSDQATFPVSTLRNTEIIFVLSRKYTFVKIFCTKQHKPTALHFYISSRSWLKADFYSSVCGVSPFHWQQKKNLIYHLECLHHRRHICVWYLFPRSAM